jgi:phage gpG-like protein
MITSNLKLVREATKKAGKSIDDGARATRDEMMVTLIQLAKAEIVGRRPKGERATSGKPPMNRTGNLRRSIRGEKYNVGFAKYEAIVGPTMIYGRAVEMGGAPTWTRGQKFPYMSPAYAKFRLIAPRIVQKHMAIGGK